MSSPKREVRKRRRARVPTGYAAVLADVKQLIADSRHRALATVNRELVYLYWHIGRVTVKQQEHAKWGDAVVEQISADLRMAFPDMKGLTKDNLFRMRKFWRACQEIHDWLGAGSAEQFAGTGAPELGPQPRPRSGREGNVGAAPPELPSAEPPAAEAPRPRPPRERTELTAIVGAAPPQFRAAGFAQVLFSLSWSSAAT